MVVVRNPKELKAAVKSKKREIVIADSKLAKKVYRFKKIKKLSKWTVRILLAGGAVSAIGVALAPATGGSSAVVGVAVPSVVYHIVTAGGTTISTQVIVAIGTLLVLGAAILFALWKDYEVKIESTTPWKVKLFLDPKRRKKK